MKRFSVRVRVPLTIQVDAKDYDEAVRAAVKAAPDCTPEQMTEAWDLLKADGSGYPHDFAEVFDDVTPRDEYGTRPCRFCFADETEYDGFTDDTLWNGFLNVEVSPEVYAKILKDFDTMYATEDGIDNPFRDIEPETKSGRYSFSHGFATEEA